MASLVATNRWHWSDRRALVMARDNRRCQLRLPVCTIDATEVDHIRPRSLGGGDELDNLRAVCHPCHLGRGMNGDDGGRPKRYSLPSRVVTKDYS
jgi:5-methylcytosine-specific restriction endonuclease McrA